MNSVFNVLTQLSKEHSRFKNGGWCDLLSYNLKYKTVKNGNVIIFMKGELVTDEIELINGSKFNLKGIEFINPSDLSEYGIDDCKSNPYDVIEKLYEMYKSSIPSEHCQFARQNFVIKTTDELTMSELINGIPRLEAKYLLESYILLASMSGWIDWREPKNWYWQSKNDKSLIVYKDWIVER